MGRLFLLRSSAFGLQHLSSASVFSLPPATCHLPARRQPPARAQRLRLRLPSSVFSLRLRAQRLRALSACHLPQATCHLPPDN